MKQETKRELKPTLRFPEFLDAGEWGIKELDGLAALITEKAGVKSYTLMSITAGLGLVSQIEKFGKEIAGESYKNYYVIRRGDFAYNKSSTKQHPEGQIAMLEMQDYGAVPNSIFTCFRVNENYISPYFLKYQFLDNVHGKWLRKFIAVGARANGALNVDSKDLLTLPIVFPALNEQQKIADCLSSLDELVAAQTQKLATLKTHKNGMMQQLFPAEGETLPKLRFPEFREAGEWEEKFIRDLGEIITGSTPSTTKRENYGGERLFVSPADISDQRFIEKTKTTLTELGFSETRPIKEGSILFVCIGSTIGKIAQNLYECASNQQINAVIPSAEHSNAFIYYSLENNSKRISELAGNHAVPIINKTAFGSVEIRFPRLPEQQKIADCFSSIDDLITAQANKLAALKAHKKGLMQQLFPSADEVQG